ncbi:hypothetical protein SCUP515_02215 [Seiridium cupressi]
MAKADSDPGHPGSDGESEIDVAEEIDDAQDLEESSADEINEFLDIEAVESGPDDNDVEHSFPQFRRLPIELRYHIWYFFDPYMRAPARVFNFQLVKTRYDKPLSVWPGATLTQQITPAKTILSVHRESRALASKFYPDTAALGGETIPVHKARDIFRFEGPWQEELGSHQDGSIASILKGVRQVALDRGDADQYDDEDITQLISNSTFADLPDLETIYLCHSASECRTEDIQWSVLDSTHKFYLRTEQEQSGVGEDLQYMYCWPSITNEVEESETIRPFKNDPEREYSGPGPQAFQTANGKNVFDMIEFAFDSGLIDFYDIREAVFAGNIANHEFSDGETASDSEENEYGSEGIDDATIDDDSGGSDSEDDLAVQRSSPQEPESDFRGFSPLEAEAEGFADLLEPVGTGFSSVEPESPKDAGENESDSDNVLTRKTTRRKRHIMTDSDDDEGSVSPDVPNTRHRQKRIVLSDSEDEELATVATAPRSRKSATLEESSSDSRSDTGDDERSSDDSDGSDDELEEPKKMSLAERLGAFRAAVPAGEVESASDAEYDEFNDEGEDDYGQGGYGAFEDDEEGDDPSENDNLIMDMAEEGLESDDEGW